MISLPKFRRDGSPIRSLTLAGGMRRGWEDYHRGKLRTACPYESTRAQHFARHWREGWDAASENDETIFKGKQEAPKTITLAWEQIEQEHACTIFRARIPLGWLVRCDEIRYKNLGGRITEDVTSDWRSAITFVPDPDHRWASPEKPDDVSTAPTASTSSHALFETADIDHLRTTLFKANKTIDKMVAISRQQAAQIASLETELERLCSIIKEADIDDPDERMTRYGIFDSDGCYQPPDRLPNIPGLEKQIALLKGELENDRNACEPCPNCNGNGVLLYTASFKEYQCTNCGVRFPDCQTLWRQLAEAEKWKEPRLKKQQPCGCVLCTCEDPIQIDDCGAKDCGQPDCVFSCGVPTPSAEWEPHPLVEERDRLLNEQKQRSNASLKQKLKRQEKTIAKLRQQREEFYKAFEDLQQDHLTAGNVMQIRVDEAHALVGRQALALQDAEARIIIRDKAFQTLIESIVAMKTDLTGEFLEALDWAYEEALSIRRSIVDPPTSSIPSTKEP